MVEKSRAVRRSIKRGPDDEKIHLDQLVTVKEVARGLPGLIRRLALGDGPFIVTRRGIPVAKLSLIRNDFTEPGEES